MNALPEESPDRQSPGDEHQSSLDRVQRWMQAVITHPGGVAAGVASPSAREEIDVDPQQIDQVILPGPAQSPLERLAVYGNAYYARLLGVLRDLFPALRHALGDEAFDAFGVQYLQRYPSQSYTLGHLADHFVQFLQETRPADPVPPTERTLPADDTLPPESAIPARPAPRAAETDDRPSEQTASWPDFLIDLARLEWAIDQVFDGPGPEGQPTLDPEQLRALAPDDWPRVRLEPVAGLRLLELAYPVNDYYTAFRRGLSPEMPGPARSFVAVYRRDYIVRRFALSPQQYELLERLFDGQPLGQAIAQCVPHWPGDLDHWAQALQNWFQRWAKQGFFQRIAVGSDT